MDVVFQSVADNDQVLARCLLELTDQGGALETLDGILATWFARVVGRLNRAGRQLQQDHSANHARPADADRAVPELPAAQVARRLNEKNDQGT